MASLLLLTVFLVFTIASRSSNAEAWNIEVVGQIGGGCLDVHSDGEYIYIGEGPNLTILDVSSSEPAVAAKVRFEGPVSGLDIVGDRAYVVAWESGLQIVDISDPTSPGVVRTYDTVGRMVRVFDDLAYICRVSSGVEVVDISGTSTPTLVTEWQTFGQAFDIDIENDMAFLASSPLGLQAYDVSNPAAPTFVGVWPSLGDTRDVLTSGSTVFVTGASLYVFDFGTSTPATFMTEFPLAGAGMGMYQVGDVLYVGTLAGTVHILDVSDPFDPVELGRYRRAVWSESVYATTDTAYISDWYRGLHVVDVDSYSTPVRTGFYPTPVGVHVVRVPSASHAYLAAYDFYCLDINAPAEPEVFSIYETPQEIGGADISGNLAFITHEVQGDLRILNIGDPSSPVLVSQYFPLTDQVISTESATVRPSPQLLLHEESASSLPAFVYPENAGPKVDVRGGKAIVSGFTSGAIELIDISKPELPVRLTTYTMPGFVGDIDIQGNTAYISNGWNGLKILSINDPTSPILRGTFKDGWALSFHLSDVAAQVGDGAQGVYLIDVGNAASPTLHCEVPTTGPTYGVDENGYLMYTASGKEGLHVVNIHDPTSPTVTGHFDTYGQAVDIRFHGGLIYLADKYTGLWILKYTGPMPGDNGGDDVARSRRWELYR